MAGGYLASMGCCFYVVVLKFDGVSAGFSNVDGVGEVACCRFRYGDETVLLLVFGDVGVGRFDFCVVGDPESIVVAVGFFGCVSACGVDDDGPVGVGVAHEGGVILAAGDFGGEEIREDREGLI